MIFKPFFLFQDVTISLSNNSYITWKSVCYVNESSAELKTSRAVTVSSQSLIDKSTQKLIMKRSFVPFIFGLDLPAIREVNISFGDSGDGFYKASKYIHWWVKSNFICYYYYHIFYVLMSSSWMNSGELFSVKII